MVIKGLNLLLSLSIIYLVQPSLSWLRMARFLRILSPHFIVVNSTLTRHYFFPEFILARFIFMKTNSYSAQQIPCLSLVHIYIHYVAALPPLFTPTSLPFGIARHFPATFGLQKVEIMVGTRRGGGKNRFLSQADYRFFVRYFLGEGT